MGSISKLSAAMRKLKIHRAWLAILMTSLAMFLFTAQSWCRLMLPPSMADVRNLAEKAPLIFRGHVLTVTPATTGLGERNESIANIQIDRWYRGNGSTRVLLRFAY